MTKKNVLEMIRIVFKHIEMLFIQTFGKRSFGGTENLNLEDANSYLGESIKSKRPFCAIRMGFSELEINYDVDKHCKYPKYTKPHEKWIEILESEEGIEKYHQLIIDAYQNSDLITSWYSSRNEAELIKAYGKLARITGAEVVEPYYFEHPWSAALEGKKVLVLSPFSQDIKRQYEKRTLLFSNDVLPKMDLITLDSIWYIHGVRNENYKDWFEALEYLKSEISKIDFDVALLGCGTFGTPLVKYIKDLGKQAIYMGGAIQVLFGIKGKRWDKNPDVSKLYNEHWIYLPDSSLPKGGEALDKGCYWK